MSAAFRDGAPPEEVVVGAGTLECALRAACLAGNRFPAGTPVTVAVDEEGDLVVVHEDCLAYALQVGSPYGPAVRDLAVWLGRP